MPGFLQEMGNGRSGPCVGHVRRGALLSELQLVMILPKMIYRSVFAVFLPALLMSAWVAMPAWAQQPKNVIFILADDLGWADTTLYGHTQLYQTPNIERLAKRGMTFNRAYSNSPLCSPTRASLLTGQTPARHGSTAPAHHTPNARLEAQASQAGNPKHKATMPQTVTRLDSSWPTLGKLLREKAYRTGHFGKWHLGLDPYTPLQHGFEVDVPHWQGPGPAGSFVAPWKYKNFKAKKPGEHIEDRMAQEAVNWLKGLKKGEPFYMNYWQFSVHAPFDAKAELIEFYRKKIDPKDAQRSPTYAAMVHSLDDAVGSLLDAVDALGIAEDTVMVFYSDNGGNMYDSVDGTTPTSNRPLRGGKATMFEGGVRVPCIVVWPGVTKPGSRSNELIQTSDFYPTFQARLGFEVHESHVIDGTDLMPALQGGKLERDAIFTYFPHLTPSVPDWLPPSASVHMGDWKLIRIFHEGKNGAHAYQLYHLAEDIGETKNLADEHPERVKQMDQRIETWLSKSGAVLPLPNPRFDPAQYEPDKVGVPIAKPKRPVKKPVKKPAKK